MEIIFAAYKNVTASGNVVICDYNTPPPEGKVCFVDVKDFEPCTKEKGFSYSRGSPCVFLKLNKVSAVSVFFMYRYINFVDCAGPTLCKWADWAIARAPNF